MNTLIKYTEEKIEQGFNFHKDWWGEFSPNGELVRVYAYPFTQINNWDWSYRWSACRVFQKMDGDFVPNNLHIDDVPDEVAWAFWDLAEQEMLDEREDVEKWGE